MDALDRLYDAGLIKDYQKSRDESGKVSIGLTWVDYSTYPEGEPWTGYGEGETPEEALKMALRNHPVMKKEAMAA